MAVGFSGGVADYYPKFRRGCPPQALDALQAAFPLTTDDLVLDLGCGTGQLAVPLASRVRSVIGMAPEPDMLRLSVVTAADATMSEQLVIEGHRRQRSGVRRKTGQLPLVQGRHVRRRFSQQPLARQAGFGLGLGGLRASRATASAVVALEARRAAAGPARSAGTSSGTGQRHRRTPSWSAPRC
ncbi:methyltransferase domain-containing protein [Streptomyces sp. QTS137]